MDYNCGCEDVLHGTLRRSIPNYLEDPGTRVGIGLGIGSGAVNILAKIVSLPPKLTHPFKSNHTSSFVHPPPTDFQDNTQGYKPIVEYWRNKYNHLEGNTETSEYKEQDLALNQGCGQEMKLQAATT